MLPTLFIKKFFITSLLQNFSVLSNSHQEKTQSVLDPKYSLNDLFSIIKNDLTKTILSNYQWSKIQFFSETFTKLIFQKKITFKTLYQFCKNVFMIFFHLPKKRGSKIKYLNLQRHLEKLFLLFTNFPKSKCKACL